MMASVATGLIPYNSPPPTEWHHRTWRSVSRAAKSKHCFPDFDYINDGLLGIDAEKFKPLRDWLERKDREPQSAAAPGGCSWNHLGDGKWRLAYQGTQLSADGSKGAKRTLTSVIIAGGLEPEDEGIANR